MPKFFSFFIFLFIFYIGFTKPIFASSQSQDLSVICFGSNEIDDCVITPSNAQLFSETNTLPGDRFVQHLAITNMTNETLYPAWQAMGSSGVTDQSLASAIFIEIRKDTESGEVVMSSQSLESLLNSSSLLSYSPLLAQQTQTYAFIATFDPSSGNQFQGKQTVFDVEVAVQLTPFPTPPTPTPISTTSSTSFNSVAGTTTDAFALPCTDQLPSSAPQLFVPGIVNANGQVTLAWSAVSPVTTYAINFGVQPGVYLFGNNSVGNVTSYTVSGLTPNTQYYFQVLGINGCAPGPRSNEVATTGQPAIAGAFTAPLGFSDGEVLGDVIEPSPTPEPFLSGVIPFILGTSATEVMECAQDGMWLALIILLLQAIGHGANHVLLRKKIHSFHLGADFIFILTSIYFFYTLSSCDCEPGSWLHWLCQWYWLLAGGVGIGSWLGRGLVRRFRIN